MSIYLAIGRVLLFANRVMTIASPAIGLGVGVMGLALVTGTQGGARRQHGPGP